MKTNLPFPLSVPKITSLELNKQGATPLVHRRLFNGSNVRVLVQGDSIAPDMVYGDGAGVLRTLQDYIGNAGGGGQGVNSELFPKFDGGTAYSAPNPADWFIQYVTVPVAGTVELSAEFSARRWANQIRVQWKCRAPADFKIQVCSDADGVGLGTWVDRATVNATVEDTVSSFTDNLAEGNYRLRVLGVSGTVDVLGMEISHTGIGGCVILGQTQGSTSLGAWTALSEGMRSSYVNAMDPDVIIVVGKDDSDVLGAYLPALKSTLTTALSGGYPRDVVVLAPFPTVTNNNPEGDAAGVAMKLQRNVMRDLSDSYRWPFIDLWELGPSAGIYYDGSGVHLAGTSEYAHFAHLILDRLGWLRFAKVSKQFNPIVKQVEKLVYTELPNNAILTEYLRIRGLSAGRYQLNGWFLFSNAGVAGEGGKIEISFTGGGSCAAYRFTLWGQAQPSIFTIMSPGFGANPAVPLTMSGLTAQNEGYGYTLDSMTLIVSQPGDVIVKAAKEVATGSSVYFREGSFIRAERIS